jgi:hypothetical protein
MSSDGFRDAAGAVGRLHGQDALGDAIIEALPDAAFGPFRRVGYKDSRARRSYCSKAIDTG